MPRVGDPKKRRRHFLREWREYRGLTQQQLAELMETSKTTISNVENLKAGYTQDLLELAAKMLKINAATLISRPPPTNDEEQADLDVVTLFDQATPRQKRQIADIVKTITNPEEQ